MTAPLAPRGGEPQRKHLSEAVFNDNLGSVRMGVLRSKSPGEDAVFSDGRHVHTSQRARRSQQVTASKPSVDSGVEAGAAAGSWAGRREPGAEGQCPPRLQRENGE